MNARFTLKQSLRPAVAAALIMASSAVSAEQLFAGGPAIYLGLSFAEPGVPVRSGRFTADFVFGHPEFGRVPIFHVAGQGNAIGDLRVLGHSMLPTTGLSLAGDGATSSNNWLWWTLGAAAAGAALVAAGGGDSDDSKSQGDDCVGIETGVGPGGVVDNEDGSVNPDQVDNSGCPGP